MSELTLKVENFQAIAEAYIKIDGITVLSGNNSTGKSTLSKMLYYVVKAALEYENRGYNELLLIQFKLIYGLSDVMNEYGLSLDKKIPEYWKPNISSDIEELEHNIDLFIYIIKLIEELFLELEASSTKIDYKRIISALSFSGIFKDKEEKHSIKDLFEVIKIETNNMYESTKDNLIKRPLTPIYDELEKNFGDRNILLSLFENNTSIIDRANERINKIYSINRVFYNDTPMSISLTGARLGPNTSYNTSHWEHLSQLIINSPNAILSKEQREVNDIISKIISGKVSLEDKPFTKAFTYTRASDNLSIELADSATGIMSFAILQLLLSKGLLDENTLLILDEPEAHLHPQWIVEYARVLVLLNKRLGVKFMLATHSPDMVSALRYISEQEETLDAVKFYLASKDGEDKNRYNYKDLDKDIEPIFESFNIALDRISEYGV